MGLNTIELIDQLESCTQDKNVRFDFGGYFDNIDSWRGAYDQPAIFWTLEWKDTTVSELISRLEKVEGMNVIGYKGGEFMLNSFDTLRLTPEYNKVCSTTINKVTDEEYEVIIHTQYEEY